MEPAVKLKSWLARFRVTDDAGSGKSLFRYRKLWVAFVLSTCLVSLIPLSIMFLINYYQYRKVISEEVIQPIHLSVSTMRRTLQFFFEERRSALSFVVQDRTFEELTSQDTLEHIFRSMENNFRGVVDLGVVDHQGIQRTYVGPYQLKDRNYRDHDWFRETLAQGVNISDVFLGYRRFPHFAIAVKHTRPDGKPYVLRATLNAEVFSRLMEGCSLRNSCDAFIVNRKGVLQTPSHRYGKILGRLPFPVPPPAEKSRVLQEEEGDSGSVRVTGYTYIEGTPYVFMVVEQRHTLLRSWFELRNDLALFLAGSVVLIVVVILVGVTYMVNRIKEVDKRRVNLLHQVEYTSKMASIGRLAAGVAHEINNPLAIINEKAGLLSDIIELGGDDFPGGERLLRHVRPIQSSVERCARITRRLLRFAKHIDVKIEPIDLEELLREVLGFLEKESVYRSLEVTITAADEVPTIRSDRGRLQQVFLNIVNNAFSAVEDGGQIDIFISRAGSEHVAVNIRDNGMGIPQENLSKVFEPFFTTKEKYGTGLGLSITFGIVSKLGGQILVDSEAGEWTEFTVLLPLEAQHVGEDHERNAGSAGGRRG